MTARLLAALGLLAGAALGQQHGTVAGTVTHPDGSPVPGWTVEAHCVSSEEPLSRAAATDERGAFRIDDLPPGTYVLELREGKPGANARPGGLGDAVADLLLRAMLQEMRRKSAAGHPHRVEVAAGAQVRHDFRVPWRAPVTLVLKKGDEPVRGAVVQLHALDAQGEAGWKATVGEPPRTDRQGRVSYPAVAEGRYAIVAEVGDWDVSLGEHVVEGREPVRIALALGTYAVRFRVLDARGRPVTQADPALAGAERWIGVRPKAFVDPRSEDGTYTVPHVQAGRYRPYVNANWAHAVAEPIEVGPDAPEPLVQLKLPPTGTLVVAVVDAEGRPVAGARVHVRHPEARQYPGGEADEHGEHRVELPAGTWLVGLEDPETFEPAGPLREVAVAAFTETRVRIERK